ncbi:MAG: hypothetical protein LBF62_08610 [Tannerellaceae bacterium]|jgi:hypothetical protein|nr:hypothetical protein [Tannerellaceae bacterium]
MKRILILLFSGLLMTLFPLPSQAQSLAIELVKELTADPLGGKTPKIEIQNINRQLTRITVSYTLDQDVQQDDCAVRLTPGFRPAFHWAPHLTPTEQYVIDRHVFRTPALIVQDAQHTLILIPDAENPYMDTGFHIYMDMNAQINQLAIGMSKTTVKEHVLYQKEAGALFSKGAVTLSFYLYHSSGDKQIQTNPFRYVLDFFWSKQGTQMFNRTDLSQSLFEKYCTYSYKWAFDTWKDAVWQEFDMNGKRVGAPVFIVNVTQSPNYPGEINEREMRSIWNQAWFSSLRSATGLFRYARRTNNDELMKKAQLAKELALAAPQKDGLFYGVISAEMEQIEIDGKKYNRSKGWQTAFWGNSNRNPVTRDVRNSPFHILDMSWTAYIMLQWYDELEKDRRLIDYATTYADALVKLQDAKGYFPAWLDINTLKVLSELKESPETSMSALFLLKLYELTRNTKYKDAALKALAIVQKEIIPVGRWEDFETYWSCSGYGQKTLLGKKQERNDMYKQCNFSMYWTSAALLKAFKVTKKKEFLTAGQHVLDELLMTQASWQPPYIYVDAIGGFGVMNSDGEWNDSRGSLFAEMLLDYGKTLGMKEYTERGLMALKTSFAMMYCPENPRSKTLWEKTWPFFSTEDYGFMMENYGHGGRTSPEGEGMGEFTIFDWGNGAASEAYNRILDRWGTAVFK